MTVSSAKNKAGPFVAAGASGTFPRDFLILAASHLRVVRVRDRQETVLTAGISHTGLGTASGNVTVASGLQAGDQVYLLRNVPKLQLSDYNAQGRVSTEQVERDFDAAVMAIQDLAEEQSRALTLGVGATVTPEEVIASALAAPTFAGQAQEAAARAAESELRVQAQVTRGRELPEYFDGSVAAAHAIGKPVDYGNALWPSDEPSSYFNIYGATKFRKASYKRLQLGRDGSPVDDPQPMWVVQKFSSATRDVDPSAWDQAGYYAIQSRSGGAYRAALTGFTRAFLAAGGDHIGVHGRSDVRSPGSRGYGVWAYGADLTAVGNAAACHAGEFNGQSLNDPGYGSNHQCLRLCMADSALPGNRFGQAVVIGNPTHGGEAGFHQGIWIQPNSILGNDILDGEAIRIDSRTSSAAGRTGGIRFRRGSPSHTGEFKYALRTDEGAFQGNEAVILGAGQRVSWFTGGARGTSMTGGVTTVTINASLGISLPDVAANAAAVAVGGNRVLSTRQAAIPNASGGTEIATINSILTALRVHGLIGA